MNSEAYILEQATTLGATRGELQVLARRVRSALSAIARGHSAYAERELERAVTDAEAFLALHDPAPAQK